MDDFGLMGRTDGRTRTQSVTPLYRTQRTASAEDVAEPSAEEEEEEEGDKQKSIMWCPRKEEAHKWRMLILSPSRTANVMIGLLQVSTGSGYVPDTNFTS